jgi:hypothetical protein
MRKLSPAQRDHLRRMEISGKLTPNQVVEDAQDPESPLHSLFQWDVDRAAHEHWLDTARAVIREVVVTVTTTRTVVDVVRYVGDPNRGREQGYVALFAIASDEDRRQVMLTEIERAIGIVRRANGIAVALGDTGAEHIIADLLQWRGDVRGDEAPSLLAAAAD